MSPSIPSTQSRVILINRPSGEINPDIQSGQGTFKLEKDVKIEQPKDDEVLIKVEWSSVDPAMRGWLDDARSYMPPVPLNAVMRAGIVGSIVALGPKVDESSFSIGDFVTAYAGWQEYAIVPSTQVQKLPKTLKDPKKALSVLGTTAQTAYWGLFDVAQLDKKDKLVVVSGAAGAVGSAVIQMAKINGNERVIGIAGGKEKCEFVRNKLGADDCLDYKSETFEEDLKKLGYVDVYFDNVGGKILDLILNQLAVHARIAFCGSISQYNGVTHPLSNYTQLIMQKGKLHGFVIIDYIPRFGEALPKLQEWYSKGQLDMPEHLIEGGVEQCVDALVGLFKGSNTGKTLVKISKD